MHGATVTVPSAPSRTDLPAAAQRADFLVSLAQTIILQSLGVHHDVDSEAADASSSH